TTSLVRSSARSGVSSTCGATTGRAGARRSCAGPDARARGARDALRREPARYAPSVAATDESAETTEAKLEQLRALREEARHAGSAKAVERQRAQGKLLARERAERLCDPGSFVELDRYVRHRESNFGMMERRPYGDAVVTGYGTIFGRKVFVFSQDFTVFGG